MGEAAKISLKAIGKQDSYLLSDNPDESFFNYTADKRHSILENIIEVVLLGNQVVLKQIGLLIKPSKLSSIREIWVTY